MVTDQQLCRLRQEIMERPEIAAAYPPIGIRSYGDPRTRLYGGTDYFYYSHNPKGRVPLALPVGIC